MAVRIAVGGHTNTPKSACAGGGKGVNKYIEKKCMQGVVTSDGAGMKAVWRRFFLGFGAQNQSAEDK